MLNVIDLIKDTYQHERIFLFLEPNQQIIKPMFVKELYCRLFCNFQHIFFNRNAYFLHKLLISKVFFFYEVTEMKICLLVIVFAKAARNNISASSKFMVKSIMLSLSWPIVFSRWVLILFLKSTKKTSISFRIEEISDKSPWL